MRVFVTGATGFIGSAIVQELLAHDHQVIGLARSAQAAARLTAAEVTPHRGSIEDLASLRAAAGRADGAIHTAFFHQFTHAGPWTRARILLGGRPGRIGERFTGAMLGTDRAAIEAIGTSLSGPDRPLVATFGTMALTPAARPPRMTSPTRRLPAGPAEPPSAPCSTWPGAASGPPSSGWRRPCTATATTASPTR